MTVLTKSCHIKMDQATFDDIQQRADELDLTVSDYIRKAVRIVVALEEAKKDPDGMVVVERSDGSRAELLVVW